ncbi:glycosyltransferase [Zunongwangia sp. H14]|uniref:glycosyltransferase n=1 Tax=Zunongwangia sp. H14 TaxID=3240792 RepID=UPI0035640A62
MSSVFVSIFMLTYNQENFIGHTIESILCQKTDFNFQLVIGEDCSTDRTTEICEDYAEKYPQKIKLLKSKKNIGLIQNFIQTFKECKGKYVAICDGDDYWIDVLKLQKQVSFLESNPDFYITYTAVNFLYPNGEVHIKKGADLPNVSDFKDLIFKNFIPSVSVLFRNIQLKEEFPSWLDDLPYGDWPIYLWTIRSGKKIKYFDEVTAVYRKEIGVSEKLKRVPSDIAKVNLKIIENIYNDPKFSSHRAIIKESLVQHKFSLMACLFREKNYSQSLRLAKSLWKFHPVKVMRIYLFLLKRNFFRT